MNRASCLADRMVLILLRAKIRHQAPGFPFLGLTNVDIAQSSRQLGAEKICAISGISRPIEPKGGWGGAGKCAPWSPRAARPLSERVVVLVVKDLPVVRGRLGALLLPKQLLKLRPFRAEASRVESAVNHFHL